MFSSLLCTAFSFCFMKTCVQVYFYYWCICLYVATIKNVEKVFSLELLLSWWSLRKTFPDYNISSKSFQQLDFKFTVTEIIKFISNHKMFPTLKRLLAFLFSFVYHHVNFYLTPFMRYIISMIIIRTAHFRKNCKTMHSLFFLFFNCTNLETICFAINFSI